MTILSWGYDGPVQEGPWSLLASMFGSPYNVADGLDQLRVTAVAGADRTISVAPGAASCYGVVASSDSAVQKQFATVSSGTRWDMVVLRYDWTTNATSVEIVQGATDDMAAFNARFKTRATKVDQPLALVQIAAGGALTQLIDLRAWASGTGMVAAHDYARRYLDQLGTEVRIGDIVWQYGIGPSGTVQWYRRTDPVADIGMFAAGAPLSGTLSPDGVYKIQAGTQAVRTDAAGYARITFPKPFPNGLLSIVITDGDQSISRGNGDTFIFGVSGTPWNTGTKDYVVYSVMRVTQPGRNTGGLLHRANWVAIGW